MLASSTTFAAEEPLRKLPRLPMVCDDAAPSRCTQPLSRGEQAPFDGQLLNTEKAIALGQAAYHCDDRIAIEVTRTSSLAAIGLRYEKDIHAIDVQTLSRERDLFKDLWEKRPAVVERPFYEHPAFVIPVTAAATLGAVWLAVKVLDGARD